ncbi:isochorismatase family protein [Congregibacter variabilis]|uniref:Isochorismatase family protein n=1 Tax=Congregibacter variabilis TaxID=3081200 RepID=A0ABZ0I259_9GAMM|nr:isochorismatase family protein [Congregibacter sp. IMCC43200]
MADLARQSQALGARPALVLIDMINAFTDEHGPLGSPSDAVVDACGQLQRAFRRKGLPVCFTSVVYDQSNQAKVFRARLPALNILKSGSAAVDVDKRLRPVDGEPVFEKHYASAFFGTGLLAWLKSQNADSLVIVGLTTSGCVRASVVDGLQHGYVVWVPEEAVGDRNAAAHAANLHDMHAKYAEVVSLSDTLAAVGDAL